MSTHLSSEQISRWMAGNGNPEADRHLKECPQCAAEIARLQALLSTFRSSVIEWNALQSSAESPEHWMPTEHRRRFAGGMLRWGVTAAMLAIVLSVSVWKNYSDGRRVAEAYQVDVQLWEKVNDQISRPVPASMEPLMDLIAWEPASSDK
jgi:hypothetical protein